MAALENNSIQQEYADTCAIKSQQLILNDFGVPVSEDQLVQYSIEHGWYSGDGTGTQWEMLVNCWQKLVSHVLKR